VRPSFGYADRAPCGELGSVALGSMPRSGIGVPRAKESVRTVFFSIAGSGSGAYCCRMITVLNVATSLRKAAGGILKIDGRNYELGVTDVAQHGSGVAGHVRYAVSASTTDEPQEVIILSKKLFSTYADALAAEGTAFPIPEVAERKPRQIKAIEALIHQWHCEEILGDE